jgi:Arc/MetJ family transcription regulator
MFLDRDLVSEAQAVLGTKTVVETVHAALEEAVERERRRAALGRIKELVDWDELDRIHRAEGDW